ncbi:class A beta-lactamase-related serine hydrolase [Patescibacteria group bacterium]|nr:class A beta-lactamase-related serine hydrolase [Patescibacteria group bacterium]
MIRENIKQKKWVSFLILLLIISNASTLVYFLKVNPSKINDQNFRNPYPLIDISRSFIPQEHFIVNLQPLREDLRKVAEEAGYNSISIYIEFLNTGANIAINQDLKIWPASLVKVPLAMAVMKKIENGDWSLDNELVIMKGDRDTQWGKLYEKPYGTRLTIEELLKELLINSDNTAFRVLYRNLSTPELQDIIAELGLEQLFTEEGKVSAKEYSRLFRALYISSYLKRENSQKILEWLSQSPYDEYLGQGVPNEVKFSHKIGENKDVNALLDSGIVYVPNRPYLITVMIDGSGEIGGREKALSLMKTISEKTYQYVKTVQK